MKNSISNLLLKNLLVLLLFLIGHVTYARLPSLSIKGKKEFISRLRLKAKPSWYKKNGRKFFSLNAYIKINNVRDVKRIINFNTKKIIRIKKGRIKVRITDKITKLGFITKTKKYKIILRTNTFKKPYFIDKSCTTLSLEFIPEDLIPSPYYAGFNCIITDNKIEILFSSFKDSEISSNIFETAGKGTESRTFEFPAVLGKIASKGTLGEFKWGAGAFSNKISVKSVLRTSDIKKERVFSMLSAGVLASNIKISKDELVSTDTLINGFAEALGSIGDTPYGYYTSLEVVLSGSETENINYSNMFLAPAYWFNFNSTKLALLIGVKWITVKSEKLVAGSNNQSLAAGFTVKGNWFFDQPTRLHASMTSITDELLKGSEIQLYIYQNFKLFNKEFFSGLATNKFSINIKESNTVFKSTATSIIFGFVF